MSDTDKIVDISAARFRKDHQRKEDQVEQLRDRFTRALGLEKKTVVKGGLWNFKQKKKKQALKQKAKAKPGKPNPEGG
ncbi:MAG: histone acetyltransferase (RNA polymerase elongator complex component) [Motiliproteus sp.]